MSNFVNCSIGEKKGFLEIQDRYLVVIINNRAVKPAIDSAIL